jgi:hypothetical protein
MFCSKRFFWTAIIFATLFLMPVPGHAVEIDPYSFRSLTGKITFEYERTTRQDSGLESEASSFQQVYSLDTRGNLISRRLIIYDAGVEYSDIDYRFGTTTRDSSFIKYYLKTTLLSKSAIPLTLFGDRAHSNSGNGKSTSDTATSYGFSWQSKIRRLPHVFVLAHKTVLEGDSADQERLLYRLNVDEDIGPTKNSARFYGTILDNKRSGNKTLRNTLLLRNRTDIAKNTRLTANAIATSVEFEEPPTTIGDPQTDVKSYGMSFVLISKPSKDFDQTHSYSSYRVRRGDEKNDGDSYSGDLGYRFSERMKGAMSLRVSRDNDSTVSTSRDSKSIQTSANINYSLTTNLGLRQSVSYSMYESTSSAAGETNLTDRRTFQETTTVSYRRELGWANFFANAGLGYIDDSSVDVTGGKGLTINLGTGLNGVNIVPYVIFSASAYESRIKKFSGNIRGRTRRYHMNASSKFWERFIKMRASFDKTSATSWLESLETKEERYKFNADSAYFTNTTMRLDAERAHYFNSIIGFASYDNVIFNTSHQRILYGGRLVVNFRYSFRDVENADTTYISKEVRYGARYKRPLLRRIWWEAFANRSERKTDSKFNDISKVKNSFLYQLRAWTISASHTFTKENSESRDITENEIMLSATRQFFRVY